MTFQNKFEKYLKAAPKPSVPDGLLGKLRADISFHDMKIRQSSLRRWFAPEGQSVSPWRVAAAALITVAVLLPLGYGATKLIKHFAATSQLPAIKLDFPESGALSPDGRHFAGITWGCELIVVDTSTGEQRNLAVNVLGPAVWSADGSEIAVVSQSVAGKKRTLIAVSLETGRTRNLMEDPPNVEDWSPDGRLILAVELTSKAVYSVKKVNLENKERTILAQESEVWPYPCFSPNGDWISYVTKEDHESVLHLRDIDGTSDITYSDFPGDISKPLWSPDSSCIVFSGTQRGISRQYKDLWAIRIQGKQFAGAPFPVVPDVEQMEFYNWSQNGQLAYRTGFRLGGIYTLAVDRQTGRATGPPTQLVRRGGLGSHCWSPDGKQIALEDGSDLSLISTRNGEKIRSLSLSEIEYIGRGISWSPDGRYIAFCGIDKAKRIGVFLIKVETGEVRLRVSLATGIPNFDPTWAPDGKSIAYAYKGNVYIVKVEDGEPQRVTSTSEKRKNEGVYRPVFAPDGGSVAYISGDQEGRERILTTTIDGQKTRQIFLRKDKESSINIFDLSPDGRYIVFTPGNKKIWCAPTDGGEAFQIAKIPYPGDDVGAWMPKWSPAGDSIAFIVAHEQYQYWVMENFMPAK